MTNAECKLMADKLKHGKYGLKHGKCDLKQRPNGHEPVRGESRASKNGHKPFAQRKLRAVGMPTKPTV